MDAQSLGSPTRDSFGTPPWESREKVPFGCSPREELQRTPREGEEVVAPSNIRIIQEVHGGKEMPPDGGVILPKNVQVEPFFPKGKLYAKLNVRVLGRTERFNGLPSGHTDLNHHHPGLEENFLKGVVVVIVLSAPFRLEVIDNEVTEDIKRLPKVCVAPRGRLRAP